MFTQQSRATRVACTCNVNHTIERRRGEGWVYMHLHPGSKTPVGDCYYGSSLGLHSVIKVCLTQHKKSGECVRLLLVEKLNV